MDVAHPPTVHRHWYDLRVPATLQAQARNNLVDAALALSGIHSRLVEPAREHEVLTNCRKYGGGSLEGWVDLKVSGTFNEAAVHSTLRACFGKRCGPGNGVRLGAEVLASGVCVRFELLHS